MRRHPTKASGEQEIRQTQIDVVAVLVQALCIVILTTKRVSQDTNVEWTV